MTHCIHVADNWPIKTSAAKQTHTNTHTHTHTYTQTNTLSYLRFPPVDITFGRLHISFTAKKRSIVNVSHENIITHMSCNIFATSILLLHMCCRKYMDKSAKKYMDVRDSSCTPRPFLNFCVTCTRCMIQMLVRAKC